MEMNSQLEHFRNYLIKRECSESTIEKYLRDVRYFTQQVQEITYESMREFKTNLTSRYAPRSANSMIAAVNQYLTFRKMDEYRLRQLRLQKSIFSEPEKDLRKEEYKKLVHTALEKKDGRLALILETICGTGIRISELQYFTVDAIRNGVVRIFNKGKIRVIMIPHKLKMKLLYYIKKQSIYTGAIFVTKYGNPMNRSNIWAMMKRLGELACVNPAKIFPHNFRHLFAKTYYNCTKDISKLADILGHSNINTTRIYTISSGYEHRRQIERLGLIF